MVANPFKGEIEIELAVNEDRHKQTFKLLPTPQALVEIEQATGRGLMELLIRWSSYRASFSDVSIIVDAGLRAAGYPSDLGTAQNMVFWTGFRNCIKSTDSFLAELAGGGRDDSGEGDAAPGTAATKKSPSGSSLASPSRSSGGRKRSSGPAASTPFSPPSTT